MCGIYCPLCPGYKRLCPGCRRDPRSVECPVYACAVKRGVRFCFRCSEFPCEVHYREVIYSRRALDAWKNMVEALRGEA